METSQSTPQPPEDDASAGAVDALEAGVVTPSPGPSDTTAPTPAPEAVHGEAEATGEDGRASEDPAPEPDLAPRVAELEAQVQKAAEDLAAVTAERDRLTTEAEAASASHAKAVVSLERERDEAREKFAATQAKLDSTVNEWGLQMTREKILKELERETFLPEDPKEQEQAAYDFTQMVLGRLQATRDDKGDWIVEGKAGTVWERSSVRNVVNNMCERYKYLFKPRNRWGSGTRGDGYAPYRMPPRPGSLQAIAERMKALRDQSSSR